ncbi:hypothetical protein CIT31_24575 [Mesorhizobium wenxiniae]|uniref:Uncharacterized protein n=1 Tax=Mesorhizobium wenxiniae TaxID=2014805 RepID=A0A271KD51_9HYPH|nr:hypothetical protein CIT31_24575 [Mesorhizobium wenxiniae]
MPAADALDLGRARMNLSAISPMFTAGLLFLAVLLLTTVRTIDSHRARYQGVPVRAVFDDVMKLGNLFKIMFDRNRAVLVAVDKNRFPALITMQRYHVTHA